MNIYTIDSSVKIQLDNGIIIYHLKGKGGFHFHRIDGPAYQENDNLGWYIDDKFYTFEEFCTIVRTHLTDEAYFTMILTYS